MSSLRNGYPVSYSSYLVCLMIDRTDVHSPLTFNRTNVLFEGLVRLGQILDRALLLGQARGPSAAARGPGAEPQVLLICS